MTGAPRRPPAAPCPWDDLDPQGQGLDLEHFPGFLLVRLVSAMQRKLTRGYLEPQALTPPDWRVLNFVQRRGPVGFAEVAQGVALDKAQVSRTLKHLQARGFVSTAADPAHAQRVILAVTPAGRRLHARILPEATQAQARLLGALQPAERRALYGALRKLQAYVDALPEDAAPPPPPTRRPRSPR